MYIFFHRVIGLRFVVMVGRGTKVNGWSHLGDGSEDYYEKINRQFSLDRFMEEVLVRIIYNTQQIL